jgi:hypothetical protein
MKLIKMLIKWHILVFILLALLTRNKRILKAYIKIHLLGAAVLAVLWFAMKRHHRCLPDTPQV